MSRTDTGWKLQRTVAYHLSPRAVFVAGWLCGWAALVGIGLLLAVLAGGGG